MNKDAVNNYAGSSRERTEGGRSLLRASSDAVRFMTTSNFVLQWGNRKRLRCMKRVQANDDSPGPVQTPGSRVFRSDEDKESSNHKTANHTHSNNFPQRPSSPQQLRRIRTEKRSSESLEVRSLPSPLRSVFSIDFQTNPWNWETSSAMRGMSNGLKGMALPDKLGSHENRSCNGNNRNHHQDNENNKPAAASDTAYDSKKGGSPSGSGDAISQVWPPKFVISLTNKEKEEDFLALKGSKLPQRPKKRAKFIQRTLNLVSPGAFLCDLTLERYEVREKKMTKKRPRGLKAMGNMESDSE